MGYGLRLVKKRNTNDAYDAEKGEELIDMSLNKKIFIVANGCPENRLDIVSIQEFFKRNGSTVTDDIHQADIIIFNSCALNQDSEDVSIEIIKQIKSMKKPSAEFIVCGCLPKINKERLEEVYQGHTFGSDEMQKLEGIFKLGIKSEDIYSNFLIDSTKFLNLKKKKTFMTIIKKLKKKGISIAIINLIEKYRNRYGQSTRVCGPDTFNIKVSTGCLSNCSFCAVRLSRGRLKSKPTEKIVEEFEEGLGRGYKKFALIGTDVGAYGRDQGANLVFLLKKLINKKGEYKISLRNIQPKYLIEMMPQLRNIFKSGKISFLSSSPESGNNRILQLMNRGYRIEDFKEAVKTLNKEFPKIQIRSQVIVGFPTETEEEFQDTVNLVDELHFDFVEIYMFQPRPGTKAAKMKGQVLQKVAKKRYFKLAIKLLFMNS